MSDEINMKISINTDRDGFISQECPECEKRFKIKYGDGSDQPLSFCPYCGHEGRDCWFTKEQVDYLGKMVSQEIIEPEFGKMAKKVNRNLPKDGLVTMSMDFKPSPKVVSPKEPEEDWPKMPFKCCGETIKHDASKTELYCIICGNKKPVPID